MGPLTPARAAGLKLALEDFRRRRLQARGRAGAFVIAAEREIADALSGVEERFRVIPLAVAAHADACVLSEPVRLDRLEPVLSQFEQMPSDGAVFVTFELAGFPSHHREVVTRELAMALPGAASRVADMGVGARKDGLTSWVLLERRRPRCWLFLGDSGGGKTSAAIELGLRTGMRVFHGDLLLQRIALGEWPAEPALQAAVAQGYAAADWWTAIQVMFRDGLFPGLAKTILADAAGEDFCLEMWVPPEHRAPIVTLFREQGYFPFAPGMELPAPTVTKR